MSDEKKDEFWDRLWVAYTALLERERDRKKVAQARLAEEIRKLSGEATRQDDVSRWLKQRGRPSFEELPAVAKVFGVRRDWLA